jgi:hypothetical protein
MSSQSQFFTFTLWGEDFDLFQKRVESKMVEPTPMIGKFIKWIKYQEEVSESQGHHLQGVLQMECKKTINFLRKYLSAKAHFEICRNVWAAKAYVEKEMTRVPGGRSLELGTLRTPGRGRSAATYDDNRAKKLRSVIDMKKTQGNSYIRDIINDNLELASAVDEAEKLMKREQYYEVQEQMKIRASGIKETFYPWQQLLWRILEKTPCDRTVFWVWDPIGATGKTEFRTTYLTLHPDTTCLISNGKKTDMLHAASQKEVRKVIFIDLPRTLVRVQDDEVTSSVNFDAIEELKNGTFTSNKYDSKTIMGTCPHVVCFANFAPPDVTKLSLDRWRIMQVDHETKKGVFKKVSPAAQPGPLDQYLIDDPVLCPDCGANERDEEEHYVTCKKFE